MQENVKKGKKEKRQKVAYQNLLWALFTLFTPARTQEAIVKNEAVRVADI